MKTFIASIFGALALCAGAGTIHAQEINEAGGGWTFFPGRADVQSENLASMEYGETEATATEPASYFIKVNQPNSRFYHVWWMQKFETQPGQEYHITYEAKSWGDPEFRTYVLICFLDEAGREIGYQQVGTPAITLNNVSRTFVTEEWSPFNGSFTIPEDGVAFIVRAAIETNNRSEAWFRDFSITER